MRAAFKLTNSGGGLRFSNSSLFPTTAQGSTLAVFRYPENPRFPDGIPDSPEQ